MRTKSMRIPTFHHTSPTKRAVRIKKHINCSWNSLHQTRQETTQMEKNGRPQSKKTLRP
jgi:hypothetical protein